MRRCNVCVGLPLMFGTRKILDALNDTIYLIKLSLPYYLWPEQQDNLPSVEIGTPTDQFPI